MKIAIQKDDIWGYISYSEETKELEVIHPDSNVVSIVKRYLTNEKRFTFEGRYFIVIPINNVNHFNMALNEMDFNIGVSVAWGKEIM
jgi:hypothetical protein